jgi:hypothetical protein
MTPLFSRRVTIVLPVLALLFILSACQAVGTPVSTQAVGVPASTQAGGSTSTTQAPTLAVATPTSTQVVGDATEPVQEPAKVQVDVVFGPGAFILPVASVGLAELSSYTASLTFSFDGTQAGQPKKWSKTYVMLVAQKPAARQLTITKTGDVSDPAPVFMAEADGAAYMRRGEKPCIANGIVAGDTLAQRFEPAGLLTGVIGADAAGSAAVNGAAADHYTFDERALGQTGLAKSSGEMWVASKGGYIVKYLLATKGSADYFGEGSEGTLTWDYELTGANQPVSIEIPKDCPAGLVDAPLLPDASNVESMPGMLTFDTSTSLADAAAFYVKQIPTLGWKVAEGEPDKPDVTGASVVLDFTQADKTLSVILTSDQGVTTVDIILTR